MATAQEYAAWLRNNADKRDTPDYRTVLRAFQEASFEELKPRAAPVPAAQPQGGFIPAVKAGATELGGGIAALMGRIGLKDEATAEAEYQDAKKRAAEIFKPTEEGWTEAPWTKFKETLGGSLPYMAAPLAAGAAAATLPVSGPTALAASLGAAGLTSAGQFTATNLARQMEEGKKLAETDVSAAALAAVPQAILDTAAMRMIPGIGRIFGQAGVKVTAENAKAIAEQSLKKTLVDYAAKTGKAAGVEGVTEAAQQTFERLQAGLSITDPEARKEYFESFVAGAVLGGTLSPAGRYVERGREQREARGLLEQQAAEERKATAAAEEERKKSPEYLEQTYNEYQQLLAQKSALDAQIKKGTTGAPLSQDDKDANAVINKQLAELKQPLAEAKRAYIDAGGPQAMAKLRAGRLELTTQPEETPGTEAELLTQQRARLEEELGRAQDRGDTERAAALQQQLEETAPETPEAQRARLMRDVAGLNQILEQQREQVKAAETPEAAVAAAQRAQQTYDRLTKLNEQLGKLPAAPDVAALKKKEKTLLKKFEDARESGEQNTVLKIAPQLIEVRRQLQAAQPFDLASEAYAAEEQRKLDALGEAMGAGRETAAYERTQAGLEQQTARDQAQRLAALQQELEFEGTAEREAMQERARSLVEQQRDKEAARFRTARQTTIPEPQERITRTMTETEGRLPPEVRSELAALKRELRAITRLPAQQEGLPAQEIAGPFSLYTTPAQVRDRVKEIQGRIRELERIPVDVTTTTETVGIPSEQPTIDTRPSPSVERQANALLERINASPKVDQDIKDLAAQVQDNLPQIAKQLRGMTEELAQRPPQRGVRVPPRAMPQGGDEVVQVAQWAQSVLRGAPAPDMTADLRTALQRIEVAQRSESERAPSGEISRAVQLEFPEMPEPRATAFASYKEFEDFLASKAPMLVGAQGQIALSISRLQRELAPLQAQVAELRRQEADLKQKSADLKAKTGADRAAAQALVNEAQFSFNIARNALENRIEVLIAARATAQQKYADAQAEAAQLRTTIANSVKEFEAAAAAEEEVRVAGPAGSQQQLGPVGQGFRGATIRQGELAGYEQARAAEQAVEKALDAWTAAETKLRDVIQANVGADWSDGSKALNEYLRAHDARKEAKLDLDNAKKELKRINAKRKVVTPMTDDAFGNFLVQQAELAAKLDVSLKRISGLSKYLKGILKYGAEDIDAYLKQREAAQKSLSAALQKLPEGGDVGAVLRQHMGPLRESYQRLADTVGEYRGSPEQIAAFEKAGADLQAAEQILAETVAAARPADAQAQALLEQATKTATDANRIARRVQARLSEVQKRAEARRSVAPTPPETTLSEREAQDAEKRREEQARLERLEAIPATRVEFTRSAPENREIKRLIEALAATTNPQERAAARKALGDYLEGFIKRKDTELDDMKRRASKNLEDFNKQRAIFAELTEKLKGDLTPKRRESAEKQRDEAKRKMEEHQRRYTLNTNEMKVTRTDIQAQRAERNRLLAESSRTRVAGERLGPRAIGPVTRDEVTPPKTLRTGSEESRAGATTTDARQRLEEARGMKQRDVAMSKKEMAQAQAQADKMKTLEGVEKAEKALAEQFKAAKERGFRPGEQARFQERQAILTARKEALRELKAVVLVTPVEPVVEVEEAPKKRKPRKAAEKPGERVTPADEMQEELDSFEIEILPGENQEVFFSRGATANPSTIDSVRTELSKAFPNLGRVQIYDSVDALIAANPQYKGKIPSDARGFVDTAGNKAFLIAENIDQGQALSVLLHEVGAHIGLKNMLGDAQYNALVNAVKSWEKRTDNSTEAKVAKAARARVEAAETTAGQVNDELLAYTIEEAVNAGVKPTETKGVLGQWLSRVAALFRKALEKFGLPPKTLDAQGIVDMAFGAAKMEMRPAVPQVSRRQFLRGAGAALGAMKLPPLSKDMQLDALMDVFYGSLKASDAWFAAVRSASKLPDIENLVFEYGGFYGGDNSIYDFARTDALKRFIYYTEYEAELYDDPRSQDELLRNLLEKDGVKIVADLQQALRAQAAGLVEAVQKLAKNKGLPEVGELFFTYAGETSGVAPDALRKAKDMKIKGAETEKIWNETGWFQGPDKQWRYEIDDSKADFSGIDTEFRKGVTAGNKEVNTSLGNIMKHAELYKAYPELENVPVTMYEDANSGLYGSFNGKEIKLNVAKPDPEGTLIHEIQHYVQDKEGFGRGGSTTGQYLRAFSKQVMNSVRASYVRQMEDADNASDKKYYGERVKAMDAAIDAVMQDRKARGPALRAAKKEYDDAKLAANQALNALFDFKRDARKKAEDEYEAIKAEQDTLRDKARALRKQNFKSAEAKAIDAQIDALYADARAAMNRMFEEPDASEFEKRLAAAEADRKAAHKKWLDIRYDTKDELKRAVTNAVAATIGPNAIFTQFIKLSISEYAYQNLLGEVEARDVSERRTMSEAERQATRPYSSQPQRREEILFSRNLPTAARVADQIVGKQPTIFDNIKQSLFGLSFRTQWIDALAPIEKIANTVMDSLKGAQTMYYLRAYGMRNNMTAQAVGNGVPQLKQLTRADGQKEWVIESEKGVNIKDIVKRLATKDVVKEAGSADAANRLFTLYMAALRGERVGFEKLNFGRAAAQYELKEIEKDLASSRLKAEDKPRLLKRKAHLEQNIADMPTEADIRAAKAEIEANPTLKAAFSDARDMYNEYNANLLKLLVDTGAMSKEKAAELLRNKDYIPYYRIRGGNAELVIGKETPIRVGNIKDSPHLQELIGGEEPIFNFLDSSVQNTSMLLDMAMRNIAVKNLAYELASVGLTRSKKPVQTPKIGAPQGAMEFKIDGVDYYVVPDTEYIGVPSDLLVKGMAGIPTMMPVAVRLMGIPAQILRRAVTSTPVFAAKQLFRDSLAAFMLSGSNGAPLLGAIRQLGKTSPLEARGITGGQTFTGMPDDISRLLREMQEGRPGWSKAFAKMEALSLEADAATRRSQYESYLKQGLSEMEASLMSLESMNFSKRGLSPTMHMVTTLVPFFNAQIQGLDVVYKALTGKMPFNDKLDIQRKLFTRGAMMFIGTMAYAAAMQDDEEYKNAPPDVKYGNWFLRLPFLDEMAGEKVTLRVPIPFEVGYIFKALPEMLYNSMQSDQDAKDALKALNHILIQIIPGGSSMVPIELGSAKIPVPVPIPTALKPVIEVGLGKSFFTGRDLESAREQQEVPGMRYRTGTSEIAKYVGEAVNFSPIKIEALVNGYTGGLGMALLQAASLPLPSSDVAKPDKRLSELPLVGSMFQPADAANIIDGVYKDFQKVTQAKTTYDRLVERGELGKAQAFLQENMKSIALASFAGDYKNQMGELTKAERIIRGATTMSSEDKRKALDNIKQAKIQIATAVRAFLESSPDRTEPQAVPQ